MDSVRSHGDTVSDAKCGSAHPDIMVMLREKTVEDHQRMEETQVMRSLLDGSLNRARYLSLLERLFDFVSTFETAALAHPLWTRAKNVDFRRRLKSSRLLNDIAFLKGISPQEVPPPSLSVRLPDIGGDARLLGALYVMEGASLGGQVILKRLTDHYGYTAEAAASFYAGYGRETGRLWREWSAFVNEHARATNLDQNDIIAGAREAFDCFGDVLSHV